MGARGLGYPCEKRFRKPIKTDPDLSDVHLYEKCPNIMKKAKKAYVFKAFDNLFILFIQKYMLFQLFSSILNTFYTKTHAFPAF